MKKRQKKIAVINDISGYGRCSITVSLPIISAMKIQCCPLPTAILSNHTEYPNYFFDDYTNHMPEYIENWKKLSLTFDGIATGFLGSLEQIHIVSNFIKDFPCETVLVDPVMGDHGVIYETYTAAMCQGMKQLIQYADIVTPNLTEACILTDTPYREDFSTNELIKICETIANMGPKEIIITGIKNGDFLNNFIYSTINGHSICSCELITPVRPGTGDVFAAITLCDIMNGHTTYEATTKAAAFIKKCLLASKEMNIPVSDGVCFEECLGDLIPN